MISPAELEEIKKTIRDFFKKTGLDLEIEICSPEEEVLPIKIKTKEPKILIGHAGQTLFDIQHLLNIISRRKTITADFHVDLDINSYKEKKIEYLREMARSLADEVILTKKEKELAPMPAYERRIVHIELSKREGVETESFGEGSGRRIIIKPSTGL